MTFEIAFAATVAAGGTIAVPSGIGALGSVQRAVISASGVAVAETGTVGFVTAAASGAVSLNTTRNFLFCGDVIPANGVLEVEATALGDVPTRSKAFAGLPGVQ